jgi:Tfp pilus assembly protein PilP
MKRLARLTAVSAAILALSACEQHSKRDLATLEHETENEPGHGTELHAVQPAHELHSGAPAQEAPKFFPKAK